MLVWEDLFLFFCSVEKLYGLWSYLLSVWLIVSTACIRSTWDSQVVSVQIV